VGDDNVSGCDHLLARAHWRLAARLLDCETAAVTRITHVAYRLPDGTVWSAPRPARHSVPVKPCDAGDIVQGFLTDSGAFVDRFEALPIAQAAGQLIRKTPPEDRLFSEDVW
jgi:hypothetical protein